jgi:CBS domain containing-hemolysin-like protein
MGQAFLTTLLADSLFGARGVVIGFVLNVIVFFVITEAMPKTWAVLSAERAALLTARPTDWLVSFPPLRFVSRALISLTNVLLPGKGLKQGPFVNEQELLGIVGAAADDDVIEHEERELIESIIEFGDTVAREVMVPRPDMLIVDNDATVTAALDMAIANGVSRLPVFAADGDDVVGLAYTKDLIRSEREGRGDEPVLDLARPVRFIPENKPVRQLMREMQAGKFHLAIVADEYGGIAGLVTLEDCLEELVGEIVDEYDVEATAIQRQPNGDYLVSGSTPVGDLSDVLDLELPDDDWDSVGGFVFGTLGHVPEEGESVMHEGLRFSVVELDGRRIRSVRISYLPVSEHDPAEAAGSIDVHGDTPEAADEPTAPTR